jgi:hypothetical protein
MTEGLEVTGEVFGSAASIVFAKAQTASTPAKLSL